MILLIAIMWFSLGFAENLATIPTVKAMSGLVCTIYYSLPIIEMYKVWSTSLKSSFLESLCLVDIGIPTSLESSIPNFFSISLTCFD